MMDQTIREIYEKIYNEYHMRQLDFHKKQAKRMYKQIIKFGFDSCPPDNFIANYVKDNLPYDKPDFTFTLMNAYHTYAKCLGFLNWDDLRSYCYETN